MPNIVPTARYYPKLSEVITVDDLPEFLSFVENGINAIFDKIHYKNLQYSKSVNGDAAFYSLEIVSKKLAIPLPFDMALVLNPDLTGNDNKISSFPITLEYQWEILAFLKTFSSSSFSFSLEDFYITGLKIFRISEDEVLAHTINNFIEADNAISKYQQVVNNINNFYTLTGSNQLVLSVTEESIKGLTTAINNHPEIDKTVSLLLFSIYIFNPQNLDDSKDKLQQFYNSIVPEGIENYIKKIITPRAKATLALSAGIEFPSNILKPVNSDGSTTGILPSTKTTFVFAEAQLFADTQEGIGYQLELGGSLYPTSFAEIGNTGILLQIDTLKLDLSKKTNIPEATADGRPDDFTGVYARALSVTLPSKWFHDDAVAGNTTTTLRIGAYDLLVGTGGLSGTIALETVASVISEANINYFENKFDINFPINVLHKNATTNIVETIEVNDLTTLKTYLFPSGEAIPPCPIKFPITLTEKPPLTGGTKTFTTLASYQQYLNSFPNNNTSGSTTPTLWRSIGNSNGFRIGFNKFDITFKQNKVTSSNIKAALEIKKFEYPDGHPQAGQTVHIDIEGHLSDKGDFDLTASFVPEYPITLPEVFTYKMRTVSLGKDESQDLFYIGTSGKLQFEGFLKDGLNLKEIDIDKLRIYSDGSIEFEGGSIQLVKPIVLPLGPVEVTVSAIHYGSHQKEVDGVMRKFNYFGFDGGISIDPLGVEVRGDGVKYYYCADNLPNKPKSYLHIQTLYVDLTIPASTPVAIINGWLSIPEPGVSPEYAGGIKLKLPKAKISGSAEMKLMPKYPAFIIDASLEFPVPIPLGTFAIYGFRGLIGYRYVAEKEAIGLVSGVDSWYDYYTAPQRGINVRKFNGPNKTKASGTPFAIGAGASLGTSFDDGTVMNIKAMVILSIPSMFMIDGQAAIISARLGLDDTGDPPFFAFVFVGDNSVEFGFGADFQMPSNDGGILDLYAKVDAAFFFNNSSKWHVNVGTKDIPVQATVLSFIPLHSYVMLSASGIEAGAGGGLDFERDYGFVYIHAWAQIEIGGKVSFERPQMGAYLYAGCGVDIDLCGIISFDISLSVLFGVEAPHPFLIYGRIGYSISIKIVFVRITYSGELDITWEFDPNKDTTPINPLINSTTLALEPTVLTNIVKGVNMLTNEDFELKLLPSEPSNNALPSDILNNIIPLDTYIDIKTEKGLLPSISLSSIIGGYNAPAQDYVDLIPPVSSIGTHGIRQVKHQYVVEEVKLKFWNDSEWQDYNPYKALLKPDDLTDNEYNQIINTLKIGQWQKTDGKYNTIRLMATTPFSYTEQGEPGWFIPEQFGHTSGSLFCEGEEIASKCADFTTKVLGQEYHTANPVIPFQSNEVSFVHLIGNTNEFAKVVNETNVFDISQSLYFRNNTGLQLILPQKSIKIELRLTTFSSSVTIQYFAIKPNTEAMGYGTFYCNPDPNAANPDAPFEVILSASELAIPILYEHPTWKGVSKIVIIPYAPNSNELTLLREQLAQVEEAKFQTNLGLKPSYTEIKATQYDEVITGLTSEINRLIAYGCTEVIEGTNPCIKDVELCNLYNAINDIFIKCFIDPIKNTIRDFSPMVRCSEAIINLIREFDLTHPGYNLTALFENQIKDLSDFIANPTIETYTFAWYAVQSILTILFEDGDCDCIEASPRALVEPCKKDDLICDLYKQINEIFVNCFIDPKTKDIRDFKPMQTCASAIIKLIVDFDKLHPEYHLLEILQPQITLINTFISTPNLLNYIHAWHAVEFILNYLFTLGQCDCVPVGPTVTKCYTLFHKVCWLSVEDYEYNINIPSQAAIQEDTMATVNGINKFGQPIWRPNTSYYIHVRLRDIVDGVPSQSGLYNYSYGFTTVGPLGFYHKHPKSTYGDIQIIEATNNNVPVTSLTNKILRDAKGIVTEVGSDLAIPIANNTILKLANNSELKIDEDHPLTPHIEKYPLTVLRQYIDYNRSYPNADGNLLGAKPLFYSDNEFTKISLYFTKAYASHFFQEWPAMLLTNGEIGLDAIKGKLKIVIKDPREGVEFQNPPSLDNIISSSTIPQTIESWNMDDNPLMTNVLNQYNNLTQNGYHCWLDPIEIIKPASKNLSVKIVDLKPSKLYTAIINNVFDKNGDGMLGPIVNNNVTPSVITQQDETVEIHKFVFQTSRYKNFYEQVHSYKLKQTIDNVVSERDAIFDISVDLEQYQKTAILNSIKDDPIVVAGEYDEAKINILKQYQDPFDRIVEGILGLSPINAAISTEFNFIRNSNSIDSNKIIGLLIRNPEPFNNPKIPRDQAINGHVIPKGIIVDNDGFEILHSKDYSQVLIMHNSTVFPSDISQLGITFNYITWNGFYYEVVEGILPPPAEPDVILPADYQNHSFTVNLDLTN